MDGLLYLLNDAGNALAQFKQLLADKDAEITALKQQIANSGTAPNNV